MKEERCMYAEKRSSESQEKSIYAIKRIGLHYRIKNKHGIAQVHLRLHSVGKMISGFYHKLLMISILTDGNFCNSVKHVLP